MEKKRSYIFIKADGRISREQYLSKQDNITRQQEKSEKLSEELRDLEKQQAANTL